jgi:hypothetical protein
MCNFKSFILLPKLQIRWYEGDYHSVILDYLGIEDESQFDKKFLKLEVLGGNMDNYTLDEDTDNLPSWYIDYEGEYKNKVKNILIKILDVMSRIDKANDIYSNNLERAVIRLEYEKTKLKQKHKEDIKAIKEKEGFEDYLYTWREANDFYEKTSWVYKDYEKGLKIIDDSYEKECLRLDKIYRTEYKLLMKELESIEGYIKSIEG